MEIESTVRNGKSDMMYKDLDEKVGGEVVHTKKEKIFLTDLGKCNN